MALLIIEWYEDAPKLSNSGDKIYGRLLSSTEDTSLSTSADNATKPGNATYCSIATDTASYVEIGVGNQDVASGRRALLLANERRDFALNNADTVVSYRSVA